MGKTEFLSHPTLSLLQLSSTLFHFNFALLGFGLVQGIDLLS